MKRYTLLLVLSLFVCPAVMSQDSLRHDRFSGGMMIHTGYLTGDIVQINHHVGGMPFGLGGVLRFHFFNHLRVGGEGYVSKLSQLHNASYIRLGWGGLLIDGYWKFGRWSPYVGLTLGGGSLSTLLVRDGDASDWTSEKDALIHNTAIMLIDPFIGVEFALSRSMRLTLKADYILPLTHRDECPTGVRLYLGVIFSR